MYYNLKTQIQRKEVHPKLIKNYDKFRSLIHILKYIGISRVRNIALLTATKNPIFWLKLHILYINIIFYFTLLIFLIFLVKITVLSEVNGARTVIQGERKHVVSQKREIWEKRQKNLEIRKFSQPIMSQLLSKSDHDVWCLM